MAFTRATLLQIIERIEEDIKNGLNTPTILERSLEKALAAALGGASHTLHGHIQDFAALQLFVDTAEDEYLERFADIYGIARNEATFAEVNITITGTPTTVIPIDTVFQRSDGFQYTTQAEVTIDGGGSIAAVLVATEAGSDGNISDSSTVSLTSPIAGVDSDATVSSTATEGEDTESDSSLRTRLLLRIQAPPQGGSVTDYLQYALSVSGVTRAWVLPGHLGQGTVGVTFVEDDDDPIYPDAAKVAEVQTVLNEKKPVTANAVAFIPGNSAVDMTIKLNPNTSTVQAQVLLELEDLIFREAQIRNAIDPDDVGNQTQFDGRIALSKFSEAISVAAGENEHIITSPLTDPQPDVGGILELGTVTFQDL